METKIFISKGSVTTPAQKEFIDAVVEALELIGFSPRIMRENEWTNGRPLFGIRKVMKECDGIVVIAFARVVIEKGYERKEQSNVDLANVPLTTSWNNIEGALAYAYDLPLLVVAEHGLKSDGLIERGNDWEVYWANLDANAIKTDEFKGLLHTWKTEVEEKKKVRSEALQRQAEINPEKLKIGEVIKQMTWVQAAKLIGFLLSILGSIASFSYKIGSGKWPWD